tara:strand:+ start:594 stop:1337 length:744 start_codon:yes stop_codon:yes gene_type:complete
MFFFILGTIIGSFLNVIIIRFPQNKSIIFPRSQCTKCENTIPFYHNIPIISYIILKGKCANCYEKISMQYIIIELLTGVLFYIIFNLFSLDNAILLSIVLCTLIILSATDIIHLLIPIYVIIILYILIIFKTLIYNESIIEVGLGALISILYLSIPALLISFIKNKKEVLGFGDILLSGFIGAWLGPINGIVCLFLASLIGILFVIYSITSNKDISLLKIPFGACIAISFTIIIILEKSYNFKLFFF